MPPTQATIHTLQPVAPRATQMSASRAGFPADGRVQNYPLPVPPLHLLASCNCAPQSDPKLSPLQSALYKLNTLTLLQSSELADECEAPIPPPRLPPRPPRLAPRPTTSSPSKSRLPLSKRSARKRHNSMSTPLPEAHSLQLGGLEGLQIRSSSDFSEGAGLTFSQDAPTLGRILLEILRVFFQQIAHSNSCTRPD